jgi:RNA polymerase sigma factor (sigma-70 family)
MADANDLTTELLPFVYKAATNVLRTRKHLAYHWDDLCGEGSLLLAEVVAKMQAGESFDDPAAYVFRAARRRMLAYLKPQRQQLDARNLGAAAEPGRLRGELMEDLAACCNDATDRAIIDARAGGKSMEEIGEILDLDKSNVSRRLDAIEERFRERNQ